jgi:hypothetical protein
MSSGRAAKTSGSNCDGIDRSRLRFGEVERDFRAGDWSREVEVERVLLCARSLDRMSGGSSAMTLGSTCVGRMN